MEISGDTQRDTKSAEHIVGHKHEDTYRRTEEDAYKRTLTGENMRKQI